MIHYKDKTFCTKSYECNAECDRKITKDDESIAEQIGLFISLADFSGDCGKFKQKDNNEKNNIISTTN